MKLHDYHHAIHAARRAGDEARARALETEYADRSLAANAYPDDFGVMRWISNNSVVPDEIIEWSSLDLHAKRVTKAARERETRDFLAEYRRRQGPVTDEHRAEARAAFGEGVEIVDVISGRRFTT